MTKREEKEKQAQVALKQLIAQVDKDPYNPEAYYQSYNHNYKEIYWNRQK